MSRYPRRSEYDLSQSYAARAGPRYQSSSGAETEHYASTESLSASSNEIHQTKAYPRIAPRTPAFDSPGDATPATQNRSPISTQGLANAQRSCPHDSFSARAAHVNSKTIVLRKERRQLQNRNAQKAFRERQRTDIQRLVQEVESLKMANEHLVASNQAYAEKLIQLEEELNGWLILSPGPIFDSAPDDCNLWAQNIENTPSLSDCYEGAGQRSRHAVPDKFDLY